MLYYKHYNICNKYYINVFDVKYTLLSSKINLTSSNQFLLQLVKKI